MLQSCCCLPQSLLRMYHPKFYIQIMPWPSLIYAIKFDVFGFSLIYVHYIYINIYDDFWSVYLNKLLILLAYSSVDSSPTPTKALSSSSSLYLIPTAPTVFLQLKLFPQPLHSTYGSRSLSTAQAFPSSSLSPSRVLPLDSSLYLQLQLSFSSSS